MRLAQLIYMSRPYGYEPVLLDDILQIARARNRRLGITGTLISRSDLFLQMLEGPRQAISETFARIMDDERHVDVLLVQMNDAEGRLFREWDMRDDPMPSWMWTREQVRLGDHRMASAQEVYDIFERIAAAPPLARTG